MIVIIVNVVTTISGKMIQIPAVIATAGAIPPIVSASPTATTATVLLTDGRATYGDDINSLSLATVALLRANPLSSLSPKATIAYGFD